MATLQSDLDYAFEIQLEEAMIASLALRSPSPRADDDVDDIVSRWSPNDDNDEDSLKLAEALLLEDMDMYEQELEDRELCEAEMRKEKEDLARRIHDLRVAGEIHRLPEDDWVDYGDWYEQPYGKEAGSSSSGYGESLRLYFKGLVNEERVRDLIVPVAGAGIAICDPKDNLLFYSRKNLEAIHGGQMTSGDMTELEALVEGLNMAVAFGFERIDFMCFDDVTYHYVTNSIRPTNAQIKVVLDQITRLRQKFTGCHPIRAAPNDTNLAFKSAHEAIVSQINWRGARDERPRETCVICFEDTDVAEMFSINACLHRYCFSCMKQHVEAKLHDGMTAKCPHDGCNSEVPIDSCAEFLPPKLVELMGQKMKESAIPVTEKIYCPFPKCSALMSRSEVLDYTRDYFAGVDESSARKCLKCQKFFCLDCKVPWHYNLDCVDYKAQNPNHRVDERMLKTLADEKQWRQCAKCSHMVELFEGCYHITCRCGHEFCYSCGAEWKNKEATCECPI